MQKVALEYGSAPGWVCLREMCGHDEESVDGTDSEAAIALVDRLLVDAPGAALGPGRAAELTIPDRDRILATLFRSIVGRRVDSMVRCQFCNQSFDLTFELEELLSSLGPGESAAVAEANGVYRLPDGRRFRLPSGVDERAVANEPPERAEIELLRRCMVEGAASDDPNGITDAMHAVGPLLDLEVGTRCAECHKPQDVRFDLQHYLFTRLIDERRQRSLEIHRISQTYHWSRREILELHRAQRRLHVELIERDSTVR
jgi:hypothetical protein